MLPDNSPQIYPTVSVTILLACSKSAFRLLMVSALQPPQPPVLCRHLRAFFCVLNFAGTIQRLLSHTKSFTVQASQPCCFIACAKKKRGWKVAESVVIL